MAGPPDSASGAHAAASAARVLVRAPELAELRAFCAAVDLGSIGKAARRLHVSQPALSKRLAALEAVAGTALLERSTRGVVATAAGQQLYRTALPLLRDAESVEELMQGFSLRHRPVRIAASPTIAECWLPQVLADLELRHHRHLSVELMTANSTIVRSLVREGRSDIGLAAMAPDAPEPGLNETAVWEDEVIVAVPPGHDWAHRGDIDPARFAATEVIRRDPEASSSQIVDRALRHLGYRPVTPLAELGSTAAARAAALAEGVPVLLSRESVRDSDGLLVRRVAGMRFHRLFAVVLAGGPEDLAPAARSLALHLLGRARPASASLAVAAAL